MPLTPFSAGISADFDPGIHPNLEIGKDEAQLYFCDGFPGFCFKIYFKI